MNAYLVAGFFLAVWFFGRATGLILPFTFPRPRAWLHKVSAPKGPGPRINTPFHVWVLRCTKCGEGYLEGGVSECPGGAAPREQIMRGLSEVESRRASDRPAPAEDLGTPYDVWRPFAGAPSQGFAVRLWDGGDGGPARSGDERRRFEYFGPEAGLMRRDE